MHTCYRTPGPPVRHLPGHRSFVPVAVHANNVCLHVFTQFGKNLRPEGFELLLCYETGHAESQLKQRSLLTLQRRCRLREGFGADASVFEEGRLVLLLSEDSHCHFKELC